MPNNYIKIFISALFIFIFSIKVNAQVNTQISVQDNKKSVLFIDDFKATSVLEPDYYKYFEIIKEEKLLGDYNYKRLNVDFNIGGESSIRKVKFDSNVDYAIFILGTSRTTLNRDEEYVEISSTDYKNEYAKLVKQLKNTSAKIIIVSPPPYSTVSEEEDKHIVENINAVQDIVENHKGLTYIKLYKHILHNYQESNITPKELSTWIVRLIQDDVKELRTK